LAPESLESLCPQRGGGEVGSIKTEVELDVEKEKERERERERERAKETNL